MRSVLLSIILAVALATCVMGTSIFAAPKLVAERTLPLMKRAPQEDTCYKLGCEGGSGKCGLSDNQLIMCTKEHMFCNLASGGSGQGMCAKAQDNGATCDDSDQCMSQHCRNGVCTEDEMDDKDNGESCGAASQCISGLCVGGVCQALPAGSPCSDSDQCAADYYCMSDLLTRVCAKRIGAGAECNNPDSCQGALQCSASGVCILPFTTISGRACDQDEECFDGLACIPSSNGTSMCMEVADSSRMPCTSDSDCTHMHESCQCNAQKGTLICMSSYMATPKGLSSAAKDINSCFIEKCTGSTTLNACATGVCKKESCHYQDLYASAVTSMYKDFYPKCYVDYFTRTIKGDVCGNANTVALSLAAVAAAVVAYLL